MSDKNFYQDLTKPYQKQMLQALKEFVAIDSVYDESTVSEENPFGQGVTNALKYIANLAKNDGFIVHNYDNKIVEILTNNEEKNISILAHADVVPVGTGWPQDPFTVLEKDGTLYGRGVADDKGPLLSAYYGLKALRDNNLLGNYQVRFLVGGNEESGSLCMEHYFHTLKKKQPTLGFSPDSAYPLTYAEKGIIGFAVRKIINFPELISLKGGVASNSVIERCEVKLKEDLDFVSYLNKEGVDFSYLVKGNEMTLTFHGLAAHGSLPHSEDMGTNSLNVGLISLENKKLEMIVNFRHVETVTSEQMINNIKETSKPFEIEVLGISPLLYYPKDHKLIQTLLRVYQEETGDYKTPIIASGGGTYAKEADNIVAFGMEYPGYDPIMHGVNEHTEISHLTQSMGIYAHAIIELGKKL